MSDDFFLNDNSPSEALTSPSNRDAEEALIGAVLINKDVFFQVAQFLTADDFFINRNKWIWEAFRHMSESRDDFDIVTLSETLSNRGQLDEVGGQAYLLSLINRAPNAFHAESYGRIIEHNALIEGDASITEILWFETYATRKDYRDLIQDFDNSETTILDSAPVFLASDLYFPYEYGYAFAQYLYDEGGFKAVDDAYENLPLSTEQILHPERYPEDVPKEVTLPDLSEVLGGSWTLFDQNILGEWYTFLILNQGYEEAYRLDVDLATIAAEGWGGDAYAFYINEATDEVTFILDTHWDSMGDAVEFRDAFERFARLRWEITDEDILGQTAWLGENTVSTLLQEGERTLWVISANRVLVESIITNLQ